MLFLHFIHFGTIWWKISARVMNFNALTPRSQSLISCFRIQINYLDQKSVVSSLNGRLTVKSGGKRTKTRDTFGLIVDPLIQMRLVFVLRSQLVLSLLFCISSSVLSISRISLNPRNEN